MKVSTKETFRIYWQHLWRYKGMLIFSLFGILLGIAVSLIVPLFYKYFFDVVAGDIVVDSVVKTLLTILLFVVIARSIMEGGFRIANWTSLRLVSWVMRDLANTCFQHLHRHSYSFFSDNFAGSLVKKVNRFYRSFHTIFSEIYWDLLGIIFQILLASIILFFIYYWIGIILFSWSLIFLFIAFLFVRYRFRYDLLRSEADSKVTGVLADTITNAINVKLFTGHKAEYKLFWKETEYRAGLQRKTWTIDYHLTIIQSFLIVVVEFVLMYYGILLWQNQQLTVGDLVLIQTYIVIIGSGLWSFSHITKRIFEAIAEAAEMTEIFQTPHEIRDTRGAKKIEVPEGEVVFKDVSFSYHKTRRVLKKFSLTIQPGEKIAFVGPSGSGKSTIVKLLFRFFDVEKGKIFIDDQRISKVMHDSLLKNVSLVPQDPILFHRTLMENVRYGNPKATEAEVMKAAKLAHADEFIKELPDGYNTYVGERGVKLSGGERQRVAIARAIVKNAPILVLDEATSSLDSHSEKLIQDALKKLMKGRTTIVIAHRLSTIMEMDRIIVMDKGMIVEEGSHEELLKKRDGLYKKLWDVQVGGFLGE